ncbi:Clan CA, family C19, ubiquitin hydrolase-like cysteine peptidase [Trichomonas vaginalis G3]|uniref:ubiquitinyl hydrolase 1 n=1 Tax=Trichomonas vaginalis (strain ATCC PRA-98 / G3) TaxID=412133 RepID=A2DX39_TRIV3|nr:ubiquitinyl hydrolase protein [Trichomonas vaginalis G3]EAY15066.1 Clan CA, family C19, ubiquitin hydrolase-like cysteine peptidase [Trichomonas vaginalis G3]KAI5549632.1 ubiquitinyl hydrolase protein [Trichomonas vaginalis G3]|eukprot:XP_001327289.1 Clan CA, family C19, ubiquitin hydrolase-like cysteine peptidase [Trichomonas vaginalis G3]
MKAQSFFKQFRDKKSRLIDIPAETKGRKVCLVDYDWYKSLEKWLNEKTPQPPGKINNKGLLLGDTLNPRMQRKIDYEIIEEDMWLLVTQVFGNTQKIERYYVIEPESKKPYVILDYVNLHIKVDNLREVKKMSDKKWKVGPIIKQLCETLKINYNDYKIMTPDQSETINPDTKIQQIDEKYKGIIQIVRKNQPKNINLQNFEQVAEPAKKQEITKYEITKPPEIIQKSSFNNTTQQISTPKPEPVVEKPIDDIPLTKYSISAVGFVNLGNTCYFNASLQCLFHIQRLTDIILSPSFLSRINTTNKKGSGGRVAMAYRSTLMSLCNAKDYSVLTPTDIRAAFTSRFRKYANNNEHDAQEAMLDMLDALHEDTNEHAGLEIPKNLTDHWQIHLSQNNSPIVDLFHGELVSSIHCPSCGKDESVHEPFTFLSVPIRSQIFSSVSLEECINEFAERDVLDASNKWECPFCKEHVEAVKELAVFRCPSILLIQLKRFNPVTKAAITTNITYPDTLDMRGFVKGPDPGNFKLIGAVFYHKSVFMEHYTSACLSMANNKWYSFDDNIVKEIDQTSAHQGNAYILIYQKRE